MLDACADHVLAQGLPGNLGPLADAVGSSPRMLLYHFGTRDRLLTEILIEARRRQLELFGDALAHRKGVPYRQTLGDAWTTMTGPEGAPYLRLFGRLYHSPADGPGLPDFRRVATTDWLGVLEDGLRVDYGEAAAALSTLVLAVIRGLLMDRDATDDVARTDEAFAAFLALLPVR